MIRQEDRIRLLDDALAREVPDSRERARERSLTDSGSSRQLEYWIEFPSLLRPTAQRLVVLLRRDGDMQVEYHIADKVGSPFEMLFDVRDGQERSAIEEVSRFVADLLAERLVLAYAKGLFKGGSYFLPPESLTDQHRFSWITSWLGTFDWAATSDQLSNP